MAGTVKSTGVRMNERCNLARSVNALTSQVDFGAGNLTGFATTQELDHEPALPM
jgi:hypothetical protein